MVQGYPLSATLLFVCGTGANLSRKMKGRSIVHIPPGHLVPRKPDRMTKPLPRHPNRHPQAKANLRMEERTGVLVLDEILNQLGITVCKGVDVFAEGHPCSIDDGQVIPERLEQLYLALLEHYLKLQLYVKVHRRDKLAIQVGQSQCSVGVKVHVCDLIKELNIQHHDGRRHNDPLHY